MSSVSQVDLDKLHLHPSAVAVPEPSRDDYLNLKEDIEKWGQSDPIDITPDGAILDGRTRYQIAHEMGVTSIMARTVNVPDADQPAYIIGRAVNRRHLTQEQKHELIRYLAGLVIEVGPKGELVGLTKVEIAKTVGVGKRTVERVFPKDPPLGGSLPSDPPVPTHTRTEGGLQPLVHEPKAPKPPRGRPVPTPAVRRPTWWRVVSTWLRRVRPEDRRFLSELLAAVQEAVSDIEGANA